MNCFEVLSQASAISVSRKSNRIAFLTCAHVVRPWEARFKKYYPQDWINFVRPENTLVTTEIRNTCGKVLAQFQLDGSVSVHKTRDVAAITLGNESSADYLNQPEELRMSQVRLVEASLSSQNEYVVSGLSVLEGSLTGGNIIDTLQTDTFRNQTPAEYKPAKLIVRTPRQTFMHTPQVLSQGVCGGGVFDLDSRSLNCHGIVDGIVPVQFDAFPQLAGCASIIESNELASWLETAADEEDEVLSDDPIDNPFR